MERPGVEIQIMIKGDVLLEIKERIQSVTSSSSIFTVPENLRDGNAAAYVPKMVSVGPYHHNKPELQPMENHKWQYLTSLLGRKPNLDETLDACVTTLMEIEPAIRRCYDRKIELVPLDLVKILLLDACFIIELFLRYAIRGLRRRDDPLFIKGHGRFYTLRNDLIMLENQIPFFVLQRIFNIVRVPARYDNNKSLIDLSFRFLKNIVPGDPQKLQAKCNFEECRHFLDIIHHCFLPTLPRLRAAGREIHLPGATKLLRSGIRVESTGVADSAMDISFVGRKLKIPCFRVHNHLEILLRNLMAFEHSRGDSHVTSFVYFMRNLMHSPRDVRLLRREYILWNCNRREEAVRVLFTNLCKDYPEFGGDGFYYDGLCENLRTYKRRRSAINGLCNRVKHSWDFRCSFRSKWFTAAILFLVLFVMAVLVSLLSWSLRRHDNL